MGHFDWPITQKKLRLGRLPKLAVLTFYVNMKCLPFGFVRRGKLWAKDMGYSEVLLGTWGTLWGIHWEIEEHHLEHMKIYWEKKSQNRQMCNYKT